MCISSDCLHTNYIIYYDIDWQIIRWLASNFDWQRLLFVKLYRKTILVLLQNPSCKSIVSMSVLYVQTYVKLLRFCWNSMRILCIHLFNYTILTNHKNWLKVCITFIRYTGRTRLVTTYVERTAIRSMCNKIALKMRDKLAL